MKCGYGHYVRLMKQFGTVVDVFLGLDPGFQEVIADITARMGQGMADFIQKEVPWEGMRGEGNWPMGRLARENRGASTRWARICGRHGTLHTGRGIAWEARGGGCKQRVGKGGQGDQQ